MKISVHSATTDYKPKVQYVLDFLISHPYNREEHIFDLNSDDADIHLYYGGGEVPSGFWRIPCQNLIFKESIVNVEELTANWYLLEGSRLYSVEDNSKPPSAFVMEQRFGFDWIEMVFFHLSRYEEVFCPDNKKDQWDMMWEKDQFLVKHRIHQIPVVDQFVASLFSVFKINVQLENTQFSLTHDIDVLLKYSSFYRFSRALGREWLDYKSLTRNFASLKRYIRVHRKKEPDPYDSFSFLFRKDEDLPNISQKIVYFMSGGETRYDNFYKINSLHARSVIELAKKYNYKIGLHPSYNAFKKQQLFAKEKAKLQQIAGTAVNHSRQHFLHFSFGNTPVILENMNLKTDSSLGYQRIIGFRCGTGFGYSLYNFHEQKAYTWKEWPMVIMDGAMLEESEGNIDKAKNNVESFLQANKLGTHITLNFHNTIFDPMKRNADRMKDMYVHLLNFINSM